MSGTYLPLIGAQNIVAAVDASAAALLPGKINGVLAAGRAGKQKTQVLVSLDNASTNAVPATTAALLFSLTVALPPGFDLPAAEGEVGFNYSKILPKVTAEVIASGFDVTAEEWPTNLTALITELGSFPANLASLSGRLVATIPASTAYPQGALRFAFTGAASTGAIASPIILAEIDFGASVAN